MSEERMIEIASSIVENNDPLWIVGYLISLREEGVMFDQCVGESKYKNMNRVDGIYHFAKEYLESKNIVVKTAMADYDIGQSNAMEDSYDGVSEWQRMFGFDDAIKIVSRDGVRRK